MYERVFLHPLRHFLMRVPFSRYQMLVKITGNPWIMIAFMTDSRQQDIDSFGIALAVLMASRDFVIVKNYCR
jgi:hypothetical protein